MSLIDAMQLGVGVFSAAVLAMVWKELRTQNAFHREMLRAAAKERAIMQHDLVTLKMQALKNVSHRPSAI